MRKMIRKFKDWYFLQIVKDEGGIALLGYRDSMRKFVNKYAGYLTKEQNELFDRLVIEGRIIYKGKKWSTPASRECKSFSEHLIYEPK